MSLFLFVGSRQQCSYANTIPFIQVLNHISAMFVVEHLGNEVHSGNITGYTLVLCPSPVNSVAKHSVSKEFSR